MTVHLQRSNNNVSQLCRAEKRQSAINFNRPSINNALHISKSDFKKSDEYMTLLSKENEVTKSKYVPKEKPFRYKIFSSFTDSFPDNFISYQDPIIDKFESSYRNGPTHVPKLRRKLPPSNKLYKKNYANDIEIMKQLLEKIGWPKEKDSFDSDFCSWSKTSFDKYESPNLLFNTSNRHNYRNYLPLSRTQKFIIDTVMPRKKDVKDKNINAFECDEIREIEEKFEFLKHSPNHRSMTKKDSDDKTKSMSVRAENKSKSKSKQLSKINLHVADTIHIMKKLTDIDFYMPESVHKILKAKRILTNIINRRKMMKVDAPTTLNNISRTSTAGRIGSIRESLLDQKMVYKSKLYNRKLLLKVEEILEERLDTLLSRLTYKMADDINMARVVSANVRKRMKDLFDSKVFRVIVYVHIFQDLGQDCFLASRCLVNYENDNFCWKNYSSKDLCCTTCVFWIKDEEEI